MTTAFSASATFSPKRVQELLGLSRTVVAGLVAAGFVVPQRGPRNEQRFSFKDLLLLRTAHELQRAAIPPRKILAALRKLAQTLPAELPLTGLRITAVGAEIAVHDRGGRWNPDTGQVLMDFDVAVSPGQLAFLRRVAAPADPHAAVADAQTWFDCGLSAEAHDVETAERAYRQAIALDEFHVCAYVNLGALLCEAGRCEDAVVLYEAALAAGATSALLHYNLGFALEDLGLFHRALASYINALDLEPALRDAHYNAGLLLDRMGDKQGALRHFSAYRRLDKA